MSLLEAFNIVVENAGQLTDDQIKKLEFVAWSEGMERFVALGTYDDEGPQSYDEIRGV